MPSSSQRHHRPGVHVTMASNEPNDASAASQVQSYLEKQLKRATNLEDQLQTLGTTSSGNTMEMAQKHRHHLCEVLSDLIMTSPKFAMENECFHRLWRSCFYNPIKEWRSRVNRDKRKQSPSLKQTQHGFKNFLHEAITLYDYLINDYLGKLVPPPTQQSNDADSSQQIQESQATLLNDDDQQQHQQNSSQDSSVAMCDPTIPKPPFDTTFTGVVTGLYKLYIYMGDLQRYAESLNKAETYYLNASKLGPGYGNPYNQLAVVNFNRDNYCNSLYWYARSLLATHEKFSTSSGNLERLFITNREKLQEFGRDTKPTVLSEDTIMIATTGSRNGKRPTKEELSLMKEKKNAASKSLLSHFVDLQYDFFLLLKNNNNGDEDGSVDIESLREKMDTVIASLSSILQYSAFGDSLLCRLVVICSFSVQNATSTVNSLTSNVGNPGIDTTLATKIPSTFLFMLGTTFAKRMESVLVGISEKAHPGKSVPSVRLLLPLDILLEFVNSLGLLLDERWPDDASQNVQVHFWNSIVTIGNLLQQLVDRYKLQRLPQTEEDAPSPAIMRLKEYQALKGYQPFRLHSGDGMEADHGLISPTEAIEVLELNPISQTQETAGASTVSGNSTEETKTKIFRFLELCKLFASSECPAPISIAKDGSFVFAMIEEQYQQKAENEPQDVGDVFMDSMDDDAGDVVLYQIPQNGADPPLLVPGNFASQSTKSPPMVDGMHISTSGASAEVERHSEVAERPPTLMPPPGFGPPPGLSTQIHQDVPAFSNLNSIGNLQDDPSRTFTSAPMVLPLQEMYNSSNGYPYNSGYSNPNYEHGLTIAESPYLFGDLRTSNPFAPTCMPQQHHDQPLLGGHSSFGLRENDNSMEETSFLDSGLLNSLFGEVKTNNPWATK
ncbi:est1 DNA/RNA binding domain containing protein [Nitzschia inconspicua]|uniref:Est1 DNA/RNA binding domain containing protein n=1 Tax=Nitzschia inconspicua TaxID=303405 RepID=A0A9K3Q419_9STRA|nr:est1 DNA/RNA binding domain containing protein [Nitzschia inconspicua]